MFDDFFDICENHCFSVKLVRLLFGQLLEKLGLLFISISGHTDADSTTAAFQTFGLPLFGDKNDAQNKK